MTSSWEVCRPFRPLVQSQSFEREDWVAMPRNLATQASQRYSFNQTLPDYRGTLVSDLIPCSSSIVYPSLQQTYRMVTLHSLLISASSISPLSSSCGSKIQGDLSCTSIAPVTHINIPLHWAGYRWSCRYSGLREDIVKRNNLVSTSIPDDDKDRSLLWLYCVSD